MGWYSGWGQWPGSTGGARAGIRAGIRVGGRDIGDDLGDGVRGSAVSGEGDGERAVLGHAQRTLEANACASLKLLFRGAVVLGYRADFSELRLLFVASCPTALCAWCGERAAP